MNAEQQRVGAAGLGAAMPGLLRVAVMMTCHNRRDLTERCLESLTKATNYATGAVTVETFLVDDGSTDGTSDRVRQRFSWVHVIEGAGDLYWCGGMRLAWQHAEEGDFDAYLWLNDDVALAPDALVRLADALGERHREEGKAVILVGATRDESGAGPPAASYGSLGDRGVQPPGDVARRIELFNGNIVLVTREAFRSIGSLSAAYTHGLGDIDYGIRAKRKGVPVWLAAGYLGSCESNAVARWRRPDLPFLIRLRELHRPTGCPPWQLARLVWSNGGWWFPWSVLKLYAQTVFPARKGGEL